MVYLEITLKIKPENRSEATAVYNKYRQQFLDTVPGAKSKKLLVRDDDVQVLHGFDAKQDAEAYLTSNMFAKDVVGELSSLLDAAPDIRIYQVV